MHRLLRLDRHECELQLVVRGEEAQERPGTTSPEGRAVLADRTCLPALHSLPTNHDDRWTEAAVILLLERRGVSPRRTAEGDVANRPGAALRYRRNFLTPSATLVVCPPPRGATSRIILLRQLLVRRPQHGRGGGTSSSVQSVSSWFGFLKISIMVPALTFPSPGPISRFLIPSPREGDIPSSLGFGCATVQGGK